MSPASPRIALYIDGANLHATARTLGFDLDYRRLLAEFCTRGTVLRAFYYTATVEDLEYSSLRPLLDWLDYNGYTVVARPAKEFVDAGGRRKIKGNMEVTLAVDAMEFAAEVDEMILFSGDGDFRRLIEAVQRRGVRVTVFRANRRSSRTSCAARRTLSSIWRNYARRSAVTPPSGWPHATGARVLLAAAIRDGGASGNAVAAGCEDTTMMSTSQADDVDAHRQQDGDAQRHDEQEEFSQGRSLPRTQTPRWRN